MACRLYVTERGPSLSHLSSAVTAPLGGFAAVRPRLMKQLTFGGGGSVDLCRGIARVVLRRMSGDVTVGR